MPNYPLLPIITPEPAASRKSTAEKYGGLLYLGIAGLVAVSGLIVLFSFGVWSMTAVWSDIYTLSDPKRSESDRVNAAWRLSRDSRVTDRQKWDLAMNRSLPPLVRYLLAESLTAEAVAADPRAYAIAASRSKGWPEWLRVLVARPLAYAAATGRPVDRGALLELSGHVDRYVAIWADFALIQDGHDEAAVDATDRLRRATKDASGLERGFAEQLLAATGVAQPQLAEALDAATLKLRRGHPSSREVWAGWEESGAGISRVPAPVLPSTAL